MDIAEKTLQLKQDIDDVYEAGKQVGKQEEYDAFWEQYQEGGIAKCYIYAFAYNRFSDETYNPKYPIKCSTGVTTGRSVFYRSGLTDTKVDFYTLNATNLQQCFQESGLVTIRGLHVNEDTTYSSTFGACPNLKNIMIYGIIGEDIDFRTSPLTTKSIVNIIEHLSDTSSGKTLTLKASAVNGMEFPYKSEESGVTYNSWDELIGIKNNWTISKV